MHGSVSRSKITDANNCRLRASSLVVSHAPRKCISKNRTSPGRIIKRIVYLYHIYHHRQVANPNNQKSKANQSPIATSSSSKETTKIKQQRIAKIIAAFTYVHNHHNIPATT